MSPDDRPNGDSLVLAHEVDALRDNFVEAWQGSDKPDLDAWLPTRGGPLRQAALGELACIDLEWRLRGGEPARAEHYLASFPELRADTAVMLRLVATEIRARVGREPELSAAEFRSRFSDLVGLPGWESALQQVVDPSARHETMTVGFEEGPTGGHGTEREDTRTRQTDSPCPYELLDVIGKGGMGVVYRARDRILNREVALKVLPAHLLEDAERVDRFLREARAAARLRHPHLVPVLGFGVDGGRHWYAMPLLSGGALSARMGDYSDPHAAVTLLAKVARGVQAAHAQGIVHRDLKPANILLDEHKEPLVADFGVAKLTDASVELTRSGQQLGTPAYMAPEQAAGHNDLVGPASDVWALGVILFRLLTGQPPFPGNSTHAVIEQILYVDPPRPRSLRGELPPDLETVVLACLDKDPSRRYPNAGALAQDLQNWLENKPVRARRRSWWHRAGRAWRKHIKETVFLGLLIGLFSLYLLVGPGGEKPIPAPAPAPPIPAPAPAINFLAGAELPHEPRWVVGEGSYRLADGVLSMDGTGTGAGVKRPNGLPLLELLNRVPWPRYRYRAEVQHSGGQIGEVGLYVVRTERPSANGIDHWFVASAFAERPCLPPAAPGRKALTRATFRVHRYIPPNRNRGASHTADVPGDQHFLPIRGKWRKLTIEVTPETIHAYWGNAPTPFSHLIRATLKDAVRHLASLPPRPQKAPPPPSMQGGLGLVCCDGSAVLFRNLSVEPLPEEE